jgi:hypothetical protein
MGCMLEQQAFEHRTGHPLLLGRELAHGFELQAQIIIRPTLAVLKKWLQMVIGSGLAFRPHSAQTPLQFNSAEFVKMA